MGNKREGFCSLACYNLDLQEQIESMDKATLISKKNNF